MHSIPRLVFHRTYGPRPGAGARAPVIFHPQIPVPVPWVAAACRSVGPLMFRLARAIAKPVFLFLTFLKKEQLFQHVKVNLVETSTQNAEKFHVHFPVQGQLTPAKFMWGALITQVWVKSSLTPLMGGPSGGGSHVYNAGLGLYCQSLFYHKKTPLSVQTASNTHH